MTDSIVNDPTDLIQPLYSRVPDSMELNDRLYESLHKAQALAKVLSCSRFSGDFGDCTVEWYINVLLDILNSAVDSYDKLVRTEA